MDEGNRYRYVTPAKSFLIYFAAMKETVKNGLQGISPVWKMECEKDLQTLDKELYQQCESDVSYQYEQRFDRVL